MLISHTRCTNLARLQQGQKISAFKRYTEQSRNNKFVAEPAALKRQQLSLPCSAGDLLYLDPEHRPTAGKPVPNFAAACTALPALGMLRHGMCALPTTATNKQQLGLLAHATVHKPACCCSINTYRHGCQWNWKFPGHCGRTASLVCRHVSKPAPHATRDARPASAADGGTLIWPELACRAPVVLLALTSLAQIPQGTA